MLNWDKKIIGIVLILLGVGMLYHSVQIIHGEIPYPSDCHYKRTICELTNFIFEQGGYFAIGIINMAASLLIVVCGYGALASES